MTSQPSSWGSLLPFRNSQSCNPGSWLFSKSGSNSPSDSLKQDFHKDLTELANGNRIAHRLSSMEKQAPIVAEREHRDVLSLPDTPPIDINFSNSVRSKSSDGTPDGCEAFKLGDSSHSILARSRNLADGQISRVGTLRGCAPQNSPENAFERPTNSQAACREFRPLTPINTAEPGDLSNMNDEAPPLTSSTSFTSFTSTAPSGTDMPKDPYTGNQVADQRHKIKLDAMLNAPVNILVKDMRNGAFPTEISPEDEDATTEKACISNHTSRRDLVELSKTSINVPSGIFTGKNSGNLPLHTLPTPNSKGASIRHVESNKPPQSEPSSDPFYSTSSDSVNTDKTAIGWLDRELAKQERSTSKISWQTIQTIEKSMAKKEKARSQISDFQHENNGIAAQRGCGKFASLPKGVHVERWPGFPPLSNEAYDLTTHGIHRDCPSLKSNEDLVYRPMQLPIRQRNDSDVQAMNEAPGRFALAPTPSTDWLTSLIAPEAQPEKEEEDIDRYEFCYKCQKRHIEKGATTNLDDRDTCYSLLPDWFPREKFDKPWREFTRKNNRYIHICRILDGLEKNDEPKWVADKEYHDPTSEWQAAGRYGGWWKCRTGSEENNPGVPDIERNCKSCSKIRTIKKKMKVRENRSLIEEKKDLEDWFNKCMKEGMEKDKSVVLARIRAERAAVQMHRQHNERQVQENDHFSNWKYACQSRTFSSTQRQMTDQIR